MKTQTIIIAAVLSLQVSYLFAGVTGTRSAANKNEISVSLTVLAPVTPAEATFEDAGATMDVTPELLKLAPSTPAEATFEGAEENSGIHFTGLAPVVPGEATFDDVPGDEMIFIGIAPVTPREAGFEQLP